MRKLFCRLCIPIFIGLILYVNYTYTIVTVQKSNQPEKLLGVIDGGLSHPHNNVVNQVILSKKYDNQHGDMILYFIEKYDKKISIAYYNAESNNKITTKSIIEGLNWMLDNRISRVCISMSTSFYSEELQNWINEHSKAIEIYASYNNLENTLDYPAQYNNVIGMGVNSQANYKPSDIIYKSNKILLIGRGLHIYKGNSYLAPMQMIIAERGGLQLWNESE